MNAIRQRVAFGLMMLINMTVAFAAQPSEGPYVPLWYLLQIADGRSVTPIAVDAAVQQTVARDQASLYVYGVIDPGETRQWCIYRSNLPPHDVVGAVLTDLRALPTAAKDSNAALAIVAILKKRFPCKP